MDRFDEEAPAAAPRAIDRSEAGMRRIDRFAAFAAFAAVKKNAGRQIWTPVAASLIFKRKRRWAAYDNARVMIWVETKSSQHRLISDCFL